VSALGLLPHGPVSCRGSPPRPHGEEESLNRFARVQVLRARAVKIVCQVTARAIDYSLNRWAALTSYIDDGDLPIDNNWVENRIRPIAIGRQNWLFAGSLRAGKRAAAVMSLIHSAKLNGLDPYTYIRDVLERLPTQPASRVGELLPHQWHTA